MQYADNSTLTLRDDVSVTRCFDVIAQFEAASGSKLNMEKTEGIYITAQAGRGRGPVLIDWRTDDIEVLGTKMGNNLDQNWEKHVQKAESNLERWSSQTLSMTGRAVLIKAYALARIMYLASLFTVPSTLSMAGHNGIAGGEYQSTYTDCRGKQS